MGHETYRIVRYNKDNLVEFLACGRTKGDAEYGLVIDGLDPRKVVWRNYPIEKKDLQGGGYQLVYTGVYEE